MFWEGLQSVPQPGLFITAPVGLAAGLREDGRVALHALMWPRPGVSGSPGGDIA